MILNISALPMLIMACLWFSLKPKGVDQIFNDQILVSFFGMTKEDHSTAAWAASEMLFAGIFVYGCMWLCFYLLFKSKPLSETLEGHNV